MGYNFGYNSYSLSGILRNIIPKQVKIITDGHKSQTDHKSSTSSDGEMGGGDVYRHPFSIGLFLVWNREETRVKAAATTLQWNRQ